MFNFYIILLSLVFQAISVKSMDTDTTDFPLINTTTADVTTATGCDRVEYVRQGLHKYLEIVPAGVCYPSIQGSQMLVCDGPNTMKELSWYNDECHGDISDSETIQESLRSFDISNLSIYCCTGNQCPYVNILVYDFDGISDCSNPDNLNITKDGDLNLISSEGPYVINSCDYINRDDDHLLGDQSTLYQCLNGTFVEHEYEDNLNCNGEIDHTEMISDGDCYAYSSTKRTKISKVVCGVAIDTCTTTTAEPTTTAKPTTTAEPTISSSKTTLKELPSTTTSIDVTNTGCDRLEYTYSYGGSSNYLNIIPAGVCLRSIIGSEMYVCDDSSTMREISWYDSDECKGDISYSQSVEESLEFYDNVSISITCCTGNQCPYVDVVVYDFDGIANCTNSADLDIKDGDVNYISSDGPFVIDSCEYRNYDWASYSTSYECIDGKFIEYEYEDNLKCEGTIDETEETSTGDCYAYSSTTKIQISEVICSTAIDTCGNYGSTTTDTPTTLASMTTTTIVGTGIYGSSAIILSPVYIIHGIIIGLVMFV